MAVAFLVVATQAGCTALLSATALRDAVREATEATADAEDPVEDAGVAARSPAESSEHDATLLADTPPSDEAPIETEAAAQPSATSATLDRAIDRLAAAGRLDDNTQAALLAQLEDAPQQDWPVIIDAFVESIESSRVAFKQIPTEKAPEADPLRFPAIDAAPAVQPEPQITAENLAADAAPAPIAPDATAAPAAIVAVAMIEPSDSVEPPVHDTTPPVTAAAPQPLAISGDPDVEQATAEIEELPADQTRPELAVINACFASRVRAWGVVDRFASSRFHPGQDVIIYFELENLSISESDVGHSTRIDTELRLEALDGRRLHEWRFEPVEETCHARRRDYFARYVLRIPDHVPPGECRLHLAVTDEIAGQTAHESLPLTIADRVH